MKALSASLPYRGVRGAPLAQTVVEGKNDSTSLRTSLDRDHDLAETRQMMHAARLLTIAAPPGAGKSRPALEPAERGAARAISPATPAAPKTAFTHPLNTPHLSTYD